MKVCFKKKKIVYIIVQILDNSDVCVTSFITQFLLDFKYYLILNIAVPLEHFLKRKSIKISCGHVIICGTHLIGVFLLQIIAKQYHKD